MGVAGAQLTSAAILVTGLTGLLAGACSMAIGEWISVQSARELYQRQVRIEAQEIRSVPDDEQEELGLDPSELGGSPYAAAVSSFVLLALGAIVPLIPYFFAAGAVALGAAIACAAVGLFVIGALITLLTGRDAVFSGTRQLVFGLLAAGVTFGLGRLIGTAVGA
jgi:VIT1/CCC1 family predicted Fe2+/Mn2+ transporter